MAAENCNIQPGIQSRFGAVVQWANSRSRVRFLLGAERIIAIDSVPGRLRLAAEEAKAETLNFSDVDVYDKLTEMTVGIGPDACIDAVGLEAHGTTIDALYDQRIDIQDGPDKRP